MEQLLSDNTVFHLLSKIKFEWEFLAGERIIFRPNQTKT